MPRSERCQRRVRMLACRAQLAWRVLGLGAHRGTLALLGQPPAAATIQEKTLGIKFFVFWWW